MASADQLKALLESFVERDDQRFFSGAMQVAAHEARLGHGKLAEELRAAMDEAKRRRGTGVASPVPIARPRGQLAGLLAVSNSGNRPAQMVLAEDLDRLCTSYRARGEAVSGLVRLHEEERARLGMRGPVPGSRQRPRRKPGPQPATPARFHPEAPETRE